MRSDIVSQHIYGFVSKRNNVGMDPNKFVTKPFDKNMKNITVYLKMLLCKNSTLLELDNLNLTHGVHSYAILSYFSHKDVKLALKMRFRYDVFS